MSLLGELRFDIRSWWHVGSGMGRGGWCHAAVMRSPDGLPWIPGRTVRGLVREAMTLAAEFPQASEIDPALVEHLFGSPVANATATSRFDTQAGLIHFGSAELPATWRAWARSDPTAKAKLESLFSTFSATALDEKHQAKDHSLRTIEVTLPMVLTAPVRMTREDETTWGDVLTKVVPLIRGLGTHRSRGLGRVQVTFTRPAGGASV